MFVRSRESSDSECFSDNLCDVEPVTNSPLVGGERKKGLTSIIETLKMQKSFSDPSAINGQHSATLGDIASENILEAKAAPPKLTKRRRTDKRNTNGTMATSATTTASDFTINNNNNHVKNERLSPGTPDTSSRSRSVTPSSASHPDTPPATEINPNLPFSGRNCSDFMRNLAAKYNNATVNDYFAVTRNGFHPPLDPRFKPGTFPTLAATLPIPPKDDTKKTDFPPLFSTFAVNPMLHQYIDMSSTQALAAMVRSASQAEANLMKNAKRPDASSPLDLSPGAVPAKKARSKPPSTCGVNSLVNHKRAQSESPKLHEDISGWTVEDVCNFVGSIDICAEYVQNFRDQRVDGAGLPLLTEDHLTITMNMKLGPALKLKSILAKKLGSCSVCLHCTHCHNSQNLPESAAGAGSSSDSGGTS